MWAFDGRTPHLSAVEALAVHHGLLTFERAYDTDVGWDAPPALYQIYAMSDDGGLTGVKLAQVCVRPAFWHAWDGGPVEGLARLLGAVAVRGRLPVDVTDVGEHGPLIAVLFAAEVWIRSGDGDAPREDGRVLSAVDVDGRRYFVARYRRTGEILENVETAREVAEADRGSSVPTLLAELIERLTRA